MFKIYNKFTINNSDVIIVNFEHIFRPFSSASIVGFK